MNWRSLFREMAEGWNWTPNQIGELTYYQARMMICDKKDLGGVQKMEVDEASAMGYIPTGKQAAPEQVERTPYRPVQRK